MSSVVLTTMHDATNETVAIDATIIIVVIIASFAEARCRECVIEWLCKCVVKCFVETPAHSAVRPRLTLQPEKIDKTFISNT